MNNQTSSPLFKAAAAVTGLYALVWMALEGALGRDILLAALALVAGLLYLDGRGRQRWRPRHVVIAAVAGLLAGAGLALLTLFLMALKTGMHAHGPEYSPADLAWVWAQLPLWSAAGALLGLGLGLLRLALPRREQ